MLIITHLFLATCTTDLIELAGMEGIDDTTVARRLSSVIAGGKAERNKEVYRRRWLANIQIHSENKQLMCLLAEQDLAPTQIGLTSCSRQGHFDHNNDLVYFGDSVHYRPAFRVYEGLLITADK